MTRKRAPKKKTEVVFDNKKRIEFLSGFRKRKNERRSRAKAELERNLKNERKRIRQEVKDGFNHLKKTFEPLRELTEEDKAEEEQQEETYEDDEVQVKIVELTTNDLAAKRNMLGANTAEESEPEEREVQSEEDEADEPNRIPGMDYDPNARKRKSKPEEEEEHPKAKKANNTSQPDIKSKKDLDRLMKTKTLKKMHQSKLFKQKERMDKKNNMKKAKRDRNNTIKSVPKHQRKQLKFGKGQQTKYRKGRMVNKKELRRKRNAD
ncbi:LOW QUALITY PROTEIN: nucleolar protein 12 [Drosophila gunungcola]|uniref:LOW QUALITY PROTEIN: nucleolar protein 12 n=1 Tax=Drosophila gunungcola TaxID=103775 RepID=UPI0022E1FDAF|nr:LOW QUALITY PROTEIN: nucleolar protein 12 [Drosophila gunungcola]